MCSGEHSHFNLNQKSIKPFTPSHSSAPYPSICNARGCTFASRHCFSFSGTLSSQFARAHQFSMWLSIWPISSSLEGHFCAGDCDAAGGVKVEHKRRKSTLVLFCLTNMDSGLGIVYFQLNRIYRHHHHQHYLATQLNPQFARVINCHPSRSKSPAAAVHRSEKSTG